MKMKVRNEKGAALIEFAIVLPLLLLFIFGIIEFGLLMYNKAMITNASREGARAAIVYSLPSRISETDIIEIVDRYCNQHLISFSSQDTHDTFVSTTNSSPGGYDPSTVDSGDYLLVRVDYSYTFLIIPNIVRIFNSERSPSLLLSSTTTMRFE